jgi:hypothetical protein
MRRRIDWKKGDSSPLSGHLVTAVDGSGTLKVTVGFPVSAAQVSFASAYQDFGPSYSYLGSGLDPEVYVSSLEEDGFVITYFNIPVALDVNYFVM